MVEALTEQDAVGQARQRIVQGHMCDLGLRATLLGDVLSRANEAAVHHRTAHDRDDASIGKLLDP